MGLGRQQQNQTTERPADKPDPARAAFALAAQHSYREHVHREVQAPLDIARFSKTDLAFWPTCRDPDQPEFPTAIFNCQRCGEFVAPTVGWWCRACRAVVWWLQCRRGMSMVQIAASGEYDPPWAEWVQDHFPWMLWARPELDYMPEADDPARRAVLSTKNRTKRERGALGQHNRSELFIDNRSSRLVRLREECRERRRAAPVAQRIEHRVSTSDGAGSTPAGRVVISEFAASFAELSSGGAA
jgi:hypothetical protein